jgi:hypothetical protein
MGYKKGELFLFKKLTDISKQNTIFSKIIIIIIIIIKLLRSKFSVSSSVLLTDRHKKEKRNSTQKYIWSSSAFVYIREVKRFSLEGVPCDVWTQWHLSILRSSECTCAAGERGSTVASRPSSGSHRVSFHVPGRAAWCAFCDQCVGGAVPLGLQGDIFGVGYT